MCVRNVVARQILKKFGISRSRHSEDVVSSLIRMSNVTKNDSCLSCHYYLPTSHLDIAIASCGANNEHDDDMSNCAEVRVEQSRSIISASLDHQYVTQSVLSHHEAPGAVLTTGHSYRVDKTKGLVIVPSGLHVAIEYSSPNIAKPFHMGHLRSTILGNVLANLYEALGHTVTRLNWLGDWGTQFGLLLLGYERYGDSRFLQEDALRHLFEVYVRINGDVMREKGEGREDTSDTYQQALSVFSRLEKGDQNYKDLWSTFKEATLPQLLALYQRLGVHFDEIHSESMYLDKCHSLLDQWTKQGKVFVDELTGVHCVDILRRGVKVKVPLLKSDDSTLYLTRDLAAILDRKDRLQFDKIHYVVEKGQRDHFERLTGTLDVLGYPWIRDIQDECHVMFGRVEGMRSRTGQVVLLSDLLDEGRRRMIDIMASKSTTRVEGSLDAVADQLSVSSVVIQDLSDRRIKNYTFSWHRALNFKTDSGVFLQYAHARLCSLEENCGACLTTEIDLKCLNEPEALRVILQISRFDDVLRDALYSLEPYLLVTYLFQLTHLTNAAFKRLQVKGQPSDRAQARLRLFCTSRDTLGRGLQILGITPLHRM